MLSDAESAPSLFGAHPLGQHRGHDIGFIIVSDRDKEIDLINMLLRQQFLIGSVAKKTIVFCSFSQFCAKSCFILRSINLTL